MDLATCRTLHAQARRLSRREAEVEDLVQDTLVAGLQAGRDDLPWLIGTMQRLAAMSARSAVRRRRREGEAGSGVHCVAGAALEEPVRGREPQPSPEPSRADSDSTKTAAPAWLQRLPPAARRVAVLALHGLGPDEIRWILDLSPAAFRQRLTSIRKGLGALGAAQRAEAVALACVRDPARAVELQFGLVRRALKAALRDEPGLATHDIDGHLLVIRAAPHP